MKIIRVKPLEWLGNGALLQPKDQPLHDLTVDYVRRELVNGQDINLSLLNKVWVAAELDDETPVAVHGVTGVNLRVDIPIFRATHAQATAKLHQRLHAYLADQGYLGQDVFIHLSSKELPEQRCAGFDQEVLEAKLRPADRYLVTVRSV